jgi:hypothetical protein
MFRTRITDNRSPVKAAIFTLMSVFELFTSQIFISQIFTSQIFISQFFIRQLFAHRFKSRLKLARMSMVFVFFALPSWVFAQGQPIVMSAASRQNNVITGIVLNGENDAAIPNASVFITNTSRGTISGTDGRFQLNNIPPGKYELIISSIGYNTQVYPFSSDKLPLQLKIYLEPKAIELATVVVEPYDKDGWKNWGKFFLENFIGTTDAARLCKIKNYKALRFRHSRKKNVLTVVADEPLIIENRDLGYKITYQLEDFSYDFNKNTLFFLGYTLFEDMAKGKEEIPKRFLRERKNAYDGSMVHFMRALYTNRLVQEGFEVRRVVRIPNTEKERVRKIMQAQRNRSGGGSRSGNQINIHRDSTQYYNKVFGQKDYDQIISPHTLTADSLVSFTTDGECVLFFDNYLQVMFKPKLEEPAYLAYTREGRDPYHPRSLVFLVNGHPLTVDKNGSYHPPTEFFSSGYWAWNEKISHLLPADYDEVKGR